jgi:glycosyltransferase involved in cell wall biosynthesis
MEKHNVIRILLISPYFYPHIGGSQRYMEELYVHLMQQNPQIQVDVLSYNTTGAPVFENYRGIQVWRIPCIQILRDQFTLAHPFALIKILLRLRNNRYTFVHTHLRFFDATWWTWLYANVIGAKSIFTEHIGVRPVHANRLVQTIATFAEQTLARISLPRYDVLCATNKAAKAYLENTYRIIKPVHIINGGVDTSFFRPRAKIRRVLPVVRKNVPDTAILISFVGRLIRAKGALIAIESVIPLIKQDSKTILFAIAGSGPEEELIRSIIRKNRLGKKVFFLGPLKPEKVRDLLGITDIFLHPSYHAEGLPNAILEAAASGSAIVATDVAGTSEIIRNRMEGLIITPKNPESLQAALTALVDNKTLRDSLGKSARKRMTVYFNWQHIAQTYERLLYTQTGHQIHDRAKSQA